MAKRHSLVKHLKTGKLKLLQYQPEDIRLVEKHHVQQDRTQPKWDGSASLTATYADLRHPQVIRKKRNIDFIILLYIQEGIAHANIYRHNALISASR